MLEGLAPQNRYVGDCSVIRRAKEELSESDQKILFDALENKLFSNLNLAKQLTERGFKVSEGLIRTHRIGRCSCARKPE